MKRALLFLFCVLLVMPLAHGLIASIGNAKAILKVNASPEDPAILDRELIVHNKNDIQVRINLRPNVEFERFIEIHDNNFTMEPGETKNAAYTLNIDRGGTFSGSILVSFSPADPESNENPVGLSSSLVIVSEGPIINDTMEEAGEGTSEDETEETVDVQQGDEQENEEESETTETETQTETESSGPSPVTGIAIMAGIIVLGLIIFFVVMKLLR